MKASENIKLHPDSKKIISEIKKQWPCCIWLYGQDEVIIQNIILQIEEIAKTNKKSAKNNTLQQRTTL